MPKDKSGGKIKAGDRVTLSGVVVHAGESDAAPCQVLLDAPAGDSQPLVTFESRLLQVGGQAAPVVAMPAPAPTPTTEDKPPSTAKKS